MEKRELERLLRNGWQKENDYVFVSYSSQDWEKVYPCILELRARGINVFIDIEFKENSSSSWLHNLEERMIRSLECKGIIVFLSTSYLGSYACLTELIANRTFMQSRLKGKSLPVFYISLDKNLSTPQRISSHIHNRAVMAELRDKTVRIEPAEYTKMENYLLDCHLEYYPDRQAVRSLLDSIQNKFDVATIMNELIFSDARTMPSIQHFEGEAECAELLKRNFTNDKNESIHMSVLEDLRQETCARLGRPAEEAVSEDIHGANPVRPTEENSPKPEKPKEANRAAKLNQTEEPSQPNEPNQTQEPSQPNGPNQTQEPSQPNGLNQTQEPNQADEPSRTEGQYEPEKVNETQKCEQTQKSDQAQAKKKSSPGQGSADTQPNLGAVAAKTPISVKAVISMLPAALFMATLLYLSVRTNSNVYTFINYFGYSSHQAGWSLLWAVHFITVGILAGSMHYCSYDNFMEGRKAGAVGIVSISIFFELRYLLNLFMNIKAGAGSYIIRISISLLLYTLLPIAVYAACWYAAVRLNTDKKSPKWTYLTMAMLVFLIFCYGARGIFFPYGSFFQIRVLGVWTFLAVPVTCVAALLTRFLLRLLQSRPDPKVRRILCWVSYAVFVIVAAVLLNISKSYLPYS